MTVDLDHATGQTCGRSDPGDEEVATEIVAHYERADEASRLDGGIGLIERDRTRQLVERYLLAPPGVVLDVGGGAGVHALWLAEAGYEVHLSDPVPKHVEQIRSRSGPGGPSGNEAPKSADFGCYEGPDGEHYGGTLALPG